MIGLLWCYDFADLVAYRLWCDCLQAITEGKKEKNNPLKRSISSANHWGYRRLQAPIRPDRLS